ncbi:hypothetical protein [Lachnobacterium bovis]|uniref:hypothetical protein n=1 Tax=Lachnobacterium bovis TaxID=140626 RepID=UPI00048E5EDB|nr:hypothetical protein [Lachnobacterium bovis]
MTKINSIDFCTHCRKETSYRICKSKIQKEIKGKTYEFNIKTAICDECGNKMDILGLLDENIKSVDEQYRKIEGLVSIADIKKLINTKNIETCSSLSELGIDEKNYF